MSERASRRRFLQNSLILSMGTGAYLSLEDQALLAQERRKRRASAQTASSSELPKGKIGNLEISRIICGGNLISGFAHSRDLIYVSPFVKHYNTDEKIMDTLQICEKNGINTALMRVDDHIARIVNRYRKERGGKMQWIAQVKPTDTDLTWDTRIAIDNGAVGAYVQGGNGDAFFKMGRMDLIAKTVDFMKRNKLIAGVGAHLLDVIVAAEKEGIKADFYMKTFNSGSYWTAGPRLEHDPNWKPTPQQLIEPEFNEGINDNMWATSPQQTAEFMKTVEKPWIAFKILGAGAIHPRVGFKYAFQHGADFAVVGMFDFQVKEDVQIARELLTGEVRRRRPWRA